MATVLDGLTIDGTTGEIIGLPANGRSSARYAWDHEGYAREILAGEVAFNGARYALDPDKLFGEFGVSATSPATMPFTAAYNDGSTSGWSGGSQIRRGVASGALSIAGLTDGDVLEFFLGNASALTTFFCQNNKLTGSIPSLSANTALASFTCYNNELTGSIPSLSANTALTTFYCYDNELTGSIPSLSANTALAHFYCRNNNLTGDIPSLSANTALTTFFCHGNNLTGYAGGWPNKAFNFNAFNNALTETAVNLVLTEADTYGTAPGTTINLTGGTNAAPTGAGATAKANLIANGATVTTN